MFVCINICYVSVSGIKFWNERVCFCFSFNKPISLANLFAAMSSFLVRFRKCVNCEQSTSSERSEQSLIPLHTSIKSMQELGSDLQMNWFGLHLEMLFGLNAAYFFFGFCFFGLFACARMRCVCVWACVCF